MRRIFYLLLLLCLPLHGFAMQGGLAHAQALPHHHHDGGPAHYDGSDESLEHMQEHSCSPHPAGLSLPSPIIPPEQQVSKLAPFVARAVPEPFLDGPRKPPRLAPGHAAGGKLDI
ncbi:hypothetical protein [Massilia sp. H6]|uniref:hypothetical protein n=1 Tax=Massilia sp. H6 TaxID=2970464 RepID=UPI00216A8A1A|nr:hypothetical protein [Massilia sp. H6]UVW27121.1 hypothetical protein NRS07_11135 [Massilia sp. H6]